MIPWKTIADEYLQQEFTCLESLLHEYHPTVLDRLDHLLEKATRHQGDEDDLGLFEAYKNISSTLDGPLVLALYLYSICRDEWERTDSFASIRKVIRVHESLLEQILKLISDPEEAKITHVILRHISSLDGCMNAESALNASSPTGMIEAAEKVLNVVNEVLRLSENLEPRYCTIGEAIRRDALASRCYFQAIRLVATAVEAFNVKANYASTRFKEAIAAVRAAENDPVLREDFYSTERKAHRAALQVMLSRLDFPRVHVENARIIYVYPFVLKDISPETLLELAGRFEKAWPNGLPRPSHPEPLRLSDVWESSDPEGRGYGGVVLRLPPVEIVSADGTLLEGIELEFRLSRLGNHAFRVCSWMKAAYEHDVYQAMRRGSDQMGEERVRCNDCEWPKLIHFAKDMIGGVVVALRTLGCGSVEPLMNLPNDSHCILAVRSMTWIEADDASRPATSDDFLSPDAPKLFLRPVRQAATALEEWVLFPEPSPETLIRRGMRGDLVARTANTTFIYLPNSPHFLLLEFEEMAEFIATLPPLLTLWRHNLGRHVQTARRCLRKLEEGRKSPSAVLDTEEIDSERIALREEMATVQSNLALLRSSAICHTAVHRDFLDRLYTMAALERIEQDYDRDCSVADAVFQEIGELDRLVRERHERFVQAEEARERRKIEVILSLVANASVADVFNLINSAFGAKDWILYEVAAIGVMALSMVGLFWKLNRRRPQ